MDKIIKIGMWVFAATVTLCLGLALIGAAIRINLDPHYNWSTTAMNALLGVMLGSEGLFSLGVFICIVTGYARKWL